jgi:predicted ester cyclase
MDDNKALAARLYTEVFGKGNLAAADDILAPDHVAHGADAPPRTGTDGIKQQAMLLRTAIPDLETVLMDQVAEGDKVVSRWLGRGTFAGELRLMGQAIPPTGQRIEWGEIRIDRFAAGRIVESWFIPDRFALWQQLGLIPPV